MVVLVVVVVDDVLVVVVVVVVQGEPSSVHRLLAALQIHLHRPVQACGEAVVVVVVTEPATLTVHFPLPVVPGGGGM